VIGAAEAFPADLQVQIRSGRFYFSEKTPIVIPLPACVEEGIGLLTSYLSHGALYQKDIWFLVAPFVVLTDDANQIENALQAIPKKKLESTAVRIESQSGERLDPVEFEAVFLTIGRENAFLMEMVPAHSLVKSLFHSFRETPKTQDSNEKSKPRILRVTRETIREAGVRVKRKLRSSWVLRAVFVGPAVAVTLVGGFIVGIIASFDLLITSTLIYLLVKSGRMGCSFRFWNVRRHHAGALNQYEISDEIWDREHLALERRYQEAERIELFENLSDSFFVGISIHTATIALFIDAVFPHPIFNAIGVGAIVHVVLTFVAVRYYALPGILIDASIMPRLRQLAEEQRRNNASAESETHTDDNWENGGTNRPRSEINSALKDWWDFLAAKQKIPQILQTRSLRLGTKLASVIVQMEILRKTALKNQVHFLHVWSRRNGGRNPAGGPGFCYGLCKSGVWLLMCWYEHPCSPEGIKALSSYPGVVQISDEDVPPTLIPTRDEIKILRSSLADLKRTLSAILTFV